jgi:hypothetical protein
MDGKPANVAYGPDYWVHVGDQDILADSSQSHIFAESCAQDDIGVISADKWEDMLF